MFSSAIARITSSLLVKCRYTAPADSRASANRSCMDVEWNPSRRKQRRAAVRICSRRASMCCWVTLGMRPGH